MVTYKSNSANAFLNLLNLKFLQCLTLTPSARIPAQMLKANIITNAYIKPAVGVKYAKIGLNDVANIIRHCSHVKSLSISLNVYAGDCSPAWLLNDLSEIAIVIRC